MGGGQAPWLIVWDWSGYRVRIRSGPLQDLGAVYDWLLAHLDRVRVFLDVVERMTAARSITCRSGSFKLREWVWWCSLLLKVVVGRFFLALF